MQASQFQWLDYIPDLLGLSASDPSSFPFLLDNASGKGCSLLLFAGEERLVQHADKTLEGPGHGDDFFARLEQWLTRLATKPGPNHDPADQFPFCSGWFIYLGYEMAAAIEDRLDLPLNASALPDAVAWRCPGAILVFHGSELKNEPRAVAVAEDSQTLQAILDLLEAGPAEVDSVIPGLESIQSEPPERFQQGVNAVLEYLHAGDVFQVNISRPWSGRFSSDPKPESLYRNLTQNNPAPFAGMFHWKDASLLSSSPERLVELRGSQVQTRPIAGTRPRGREKDLDLALSRELIDNPKERAEHVMLIDLERNDLGRVCVPGSVEVDEFMVIESYAHVHHIVSNVRGTLRPDAGPVNALQAVFPGGTITGCPKVRCMEIIAEIEQEGRGFYTGSMGYLDRSGNMDMNILIRSMLLKGRDFHFRTGAGIVADSVPENELQETADKAKGLLMALGANNTEFGDA